LTDADEAVVEELRRLADRIDTLQSDVRRLSGPTLPPAEPGWDDERPPSPSYAWLSSLESPVRRRPTFPRLLLEILFLAACATAAAIADLDAVALAGVMVGAWVLVALIEWAASRADRRRDQLLSIPPPAPMAAAAAAADPSWYVPPVEHTLLQGAGDETLLPNATSTDSATAVTRLPAAPEAEVEATVERRAT
jgi:hypothetical protein